MKLYRTRTGSAVETEDGWYRIADVEFGKLTQRDDLHEYLTYETSRRERVSAATEGDLLAPISLQEVWAAGVTYFRSRTARMEEAEHSGGGSFYDRVYNAERPELFLKATPQRVVGSDEAVFIRGDSKWNVPEPELTLLITPTGKIIGYTVGNDMSSRDIEGENPLYLPQAKVYSNCCALGPCIYVSSDPLPPETRIHLLVLRDGKQVFSGETALTELKRNPQLLVEYLFRYNKFPDGCFLLTGTGIVPPDSFSLQVDDEIRISIEGIGILINPVQQAS